MSPRHSVLETRRTRQRILDRGLAVASAEGLEGLTIGRLATDLDMSKAGVLGHFGTKESLQLAVVDTAADLFTREVLDRVRERQLPPGLPRLRALCDAWAAYLVADLLPGGCFFTAAAAEFDDRGGPVRKAIAGLNALWQRDLRTHAALAIRAGDLPPDPDPDQLVYELVAVMLALNHFHRLQHDPHAPTRARRSLRRLLGG